MKVLIVGGAGFVGANLAVDLAGRGHEVVAADNLRRRGSELSLPRLAANGVRFEHADARCQEDWMILREFAPGVILECAAQPSAVAGYGNPTFDFANNTTPLYHLLEHCRLSGCGLVLWSTNKVYGLRAVNELVGPLREGRTRWEGCQPVPETCSLDGGDKSLYGSSKAAADLVAQEWAESFGIPVVVNRCSCLAGPWQWGKAEQGWVAWWVVAHRLGLPLEYIGHRGKQVRDVLHVADLAELVHRQISALTPGVQVFNVGGGADNALSLRECTDLCQRVTGCMTVTQELPEPRRADFAWYVSDISKVKARYGWQPKRGPEQVVADIDGWARFRLDQIGALYPEAAAVERTTHAEREA